MGRARLLLALAALLCAHARVVDVVVKNDARALFPVEKFGYGQKGRMELSLRDFAVVLPADAAMVDAPADYAFVLFPKGADASAASEACFHLSAFPATVRVFGIPPLRSAWTNINFVADINSADEYTLLFSNCERGTQTSFSGRLVQYNEDGGERDYLGVGLAALPTWYFGFSAMFALECFLWLWMVSTRASVVRVVHRIAGVVVVFKTISLATHALWLRDVKLHGAAQLWWTALYLCTSFLAQGTMFLAGAVVASGVSFLKPWVAGRDKVLFTVLLLAQIWCNTAQAVTTLRPQSDPMWDVWMDIFIVADAVRCVVLVIHAMVSLKQQRAQSSGSQHIAAHYERVLTWFIALFCLYFYVTRFASDFFQTALSALLAGVAQLGVELRFDPQGFAFQELSVLVLFTALGRVLRPVSPPLPFRFGSPDGMSAVRHVGHEEGPAELPTLPVSFLPASSPRPVAVRVAPRRAVDSL